MAIAGKDCTIMLVPWCWENLSLKVNSLTLASKVWLRVVWVFFCMMKEKEKVLFFHSRFALPDLGPNVPALFAVASLTLCIF